MNCSIFKMKSVQVATIAALSIFLVTGSAQAQDPKLTGTYGDWSTYTFSENGKKVCYMASQPKTAEGNYTRRGEVFALITHRPSEGSKNVFSYITGYTYKTGSETDVKVDNKTFELFTQDDTAWTPDAATDNRLAAALRAGTKMVVKGVSSRGTATTDAFSLKGSTKAHAKISSDCGV